MDCWICLNIKGICDLEKEEDEAEDVADETLEELVQEQDLPVFLLPYSFPSLVYELIHSKAKINIRKKSGKDHRIRKKLDSIRTRGEVNWDIQEKKSASSPVGSFIGLSNYCYQNRLSNLDKKDQNLIEARTDSIQKDQNLLSKDHIWNSCDQIWSKTDSRKTSFSTAETRFDVELKLERPAPIQLRPDLL